jgi:serine/threonine-protein kinase
MPPEDPRILDLLQQALDSGQSPEEVCADSPDLLDQVRDHLQRCRDIETQLNALFPPSSQSTSRLDTANPSPTPFEDLPTLDHLQIPGYQIHSVLGRGGMGIVFKATHHALNRTVALKMMLTGAFAGPSELSRFKREARAVAALNHTNIVQVYDVGDIDGRPFFTMEWVDGGSLAQRLAGVPQPAIPSAALVQSLASAVQTAHDAGVVHRDLKPANILLRPDGTPRITDFGLARTFEDDDNNNLTRSGARVGTPSYMAPEQASGKAVGPPADIYALGAILYEMLTGRPPFRGESASDTERQILSQDPVPPTRLNPKVPRDLQTICLTCLQKDPRRRYAAASILAQDVARFRAGQPIQARPTGRVERAIKWTRRHPSASVALAGSFLFSTAILGAALWVITQRQSTARAVAEDLREVTRLEQNSQWLPAGVSLERAKARLGANDLAGLRSHIDQASRELDLVKTLDAIRLDRAVRNNDVVDPKIPDARYHAAFRDSGIGAPPDDVAAVASRIKASAIRSALIAALDDWTATLSSAPDRQAWPQNVAARAQDAPSAWTLRARNLSTWNDRALLLQLAESARLAEASPSLLNLIAQRLNDNKIDPTSFLARAQRARPDDFWTNFNLGEALASSNQNAEAVRYYQAAVALRPDVSTPYNNLAIALANSRRLDDALELFRRSVQIEPRSVVANSNFGLALARLGRHAEAIDAYRAALLVRPDFAQTLAMFGVSLQALGRQSEATDAFRKALASDPNLNPARTGLRDSLIATGQRLEAWQIWKDQLQRAAPNHDAWHGYPELCLMLQKEDDYQAARITLLKQFGASTDPNVCERTARACLLLPPTTPDQLAHATALVDRAIAADRSQSPAWSQPYFRFAKGLAEYRAAHYQNAVNIMTSDAGAVLGPAPKLVLAMSQHQLNNPAAPGTLAQAVASFDWRDDLATSRESWINHILRREAYSLIHP